MGEPIKWSLRAVRGGVWVEVPVAAEFLATDAQTVVPMAMEMATSELDRLARPPEPGLVRHICGGCGQPFDGTPDADGARCPRCNP